jgi:hypothetical protein
MYVYVFVSLLVDVSGEEEEEVGSNAGERESYVREGEEGRGGGAGWRCSL